MTQHDGTCDATDPRIAIIDGEEVEVVVRCSRTWDHDGLHVTWMEPHVHHATTTLQSEGGTTARWRWEEDR